MVSKRAWPGETAKATPAGFDNNSPRPCRAWKELALSFGALRPPRPGDYEEFSSAPGALEGPVPVAKA